MNTLVILSLLVAASLAAPAADPNCDDNGKQINVAAPYALTGYPAAAALPLPAAAAFPAFPVQTRFEYQAPVAVPAQVETKVHYADTPVISGYSTNIYKPALGAASFALPAPAPAVSLVTAEKATLQAPAAPVAFAAAPAPVAFAPQFAFAAAPAAAAAPVVAQKTEIEYAVPAPAPVAFAPPQIAVAAPVETRIHYADTPVVTGYSTSILKPAIGSAAAFPAAVGYSGLVAPAAGVAVAPAQPALFKEAPAPEELVQTEKILAPARLVSKITPQYDVHLPAKVNVERVQHEINVPVPYAQPVPVPVAPAFHAPVQAPVVAAAYAAAPAFPALTLTDASRLTAQVPCDN